jgi:hypothetical protein
MNHVEIGRENAKQIELIYFTFSHMIKVQGQMTGFWKYGDDLLFFDAGYYCQCTIYIEIR